MSLDTDKLFWNTIQRAFMMIVAAIRQSRKSRYTLEITIKEKDGEG